MALPPPWPPRDPGASEARARDARWCWTREGEDETLASDAQIPLVRSLSWLLSIKTGLGWIWAR